jgi:hypothetical protein
LIDDAEMNHPRVSLLDNFFCPATKVDFSNA